MSHDPSQSSWSSHANGQSGPSSHSGSRAADSVADHDPSRSAARPDRGDGRTGGAVRQNELTDGYRTEFEGRPERAKRANRDLPPLSPRWLGWAYWGLLFALAGLVGVSLVIRIHDWAPGPAVVRLRGRVDLTAMTAGTVTGIWVRAGEHVAKDQLLVSFSGVQEQHDLQSAAAELEAQLVRVLREPSDEGARKQLAQLRAAKELAEARLAERSVRAPCAGVVTELRMRPNQLLQPGDIVLTLTGDEVRPEVVTLLPGYALPQVRPGMALRFEPSRFEMVHQLLKIEQVGDEVLGPTEIRRYLGPELADAVPLTGPAVIVTASLPASRFTVDGKEYPFTQGLPGRAAAQLRTRPALLAFVPELRHILERLAPRLVPHEPGAVPAAR